MTITQPDVAVLTELRQRFDDELRSLLGYHARVALIDFPYSKNCGDAAIWMGERAALRRIGARIVYVCEVDSYSRHELARRLGDDGVILLHGGGNFGDLWPQHQSFREQVVADFPANRIIQLPQSVAITEDGSAERIRTRIGSHPNFEFLARDQASADMAGTTLGLHTRLIPDAAFGLSEFPRRRPASRGTLVLARTDHETAHDLANISLPGANITDWRQSQPEAWLWKSKKIVPRIARHWRGNVGVEQAIDPARRVVLDSMARQLVREACTQLSAYRIVVTDRLHAHVLCVLLGIPHVVLDNSSGKISQLHAAWTSGSTTTRFCKSVDEARDAALELSHAHGR